MTYSTALLEDARTLRDLGASFSEIAAEIGVSAKTVRIWLDEGAQRKHVEANRRWREREAKRRRRQQIVDEMIAIREAGSNWLGVAAAARVHHGVKMGVDTARHIVGGQRPDLKGKPRGVPINERKAAA